MSIYSLSFAYSYLSLSPSYASSFNFGTNDFTIEWQQYMTSLPSHPRIFSVGTYPSPIAVSIESGTFYYWSGYPHYMGSVSENVLNKWAYFVISRSAGITSIFMNGSLLGNSFSDGNNYIFYQPLFVGNEVGLGSPFPGYIYGFKWTPGYSRYSPQNPPPFPPNPILDADYNDPLNVLVLTGNQFGGTLGTSVVNNNNVGLTGIEPYYPPPPIINVKPIASDIRIYEYTYHQ